jgi:hypothetical protein
MQFDPGNTRPISQNGLRHGCHCTLLALGSISKHHCIAITVISHIVRIHITRLLGVDTPRRLEDERRRSQRLGVCPNELRCTKVAGIKSTP